ncbi:MAG: V-type ATP synthase subunit D [Magnetococcales bacterium]|nr:V-type ATP synthase subunit D [Magnetococcales bacterium]
MEITPTRSALLESRDERLVMREGYRFLDEKRLLLATEIIQQFTRYREVSERYQAQHHHTATSLSNAVALHGLHDLQVTPVQEWTAARVVRQERLFFGVALVDQGTLEPEDPPTDASVARPFSSREKQTCQQAHAQLLRLATQLAALSGNLHRLLSEYQRTERRARALEDVILPELDAAIHEMEIRLEELDQEESVRVRLAR